MVGQGPGRVHPRQDQNSVCLTRLRRNEKDSARPRPLEAAEAWRWGSVWRRVHWASAPLLTDWPLSEPPNWAEFVNQPQTEAELKAIRRCLVRGSPYGSDDWMARTAESLGLESTLRPR